MAFRLEMYRKHWLSPSSQFYTTLDCYKSQFVSDLGVRRSCRAFAASPQASPLPSANPFAAEALVPRRVVPDSPLPLPPRPLPHPKARQIILIALRDLPHPQISPLHHLFP